MISVEQYRSAIGCFFTKATMKVHENTSSCGCTTNLNKNKDDVGKYYTISELYGYNIWFDDMRVRNPCSKELDNLYVQASYASLESCCQYYSSLCVVEHLLLYFLYSSGILKRAGDIEENPGPIDNVCITKVVQGHFHQGDITRFDSETAGKQCVLNSVKALVYSQIKSPALWTQNDMDQVLLEGDQLYQDRNITGYMAIDELFTCPYVEFSKKHFFKIKQNGITKTLVMDHNISIDESDADSPYVYLDCAIDKLASTSSFRLSILIVKTSAIALICYQNMFYIFDSHSRDTRGKPVPLGTSILVQLKEKTDVANFLRIYFANHGCTISDCENVQITFVTINTITSKAFKLAAKRYNMTCDLPSHTKCKVTMQCNVEKTTNKPTSLSMNSNTDGSTMSSKSFEHVPPLSKYFMDQKEKNEERQHQCQTAHVVEMKIDSKKRYMQEYIRNKRADPLYKAKELKRKQNTREHPECKATELKRKQDTRKDPERKAKERQLGTPNKRKHRTNTDFKTTELKRKQDTRNDPLYMATELKRKQDTRNDPLYKATELKRKRDTRKHPQEKLKETKCKQKSRNCPELYSREQDRDVAKKRKLRSCEEFQIAEREQKRLKRSIDREYQVVERKRNTVRRKICRADPAVQEHERTTRTHIIYGDSIDKSIETFHQNISSGPLYVCSCCHQTWFKYSVINTANLVLSDEHKQLLTKCLTGYISVNEIEWICRTCRESIGKGNVPKLSIQNGVGFHEKPPELDLHALEERLVSLRIPFMQMRELPVGGQKTVRGNVVNVPIDVVQTVTSLPRNLTDVETIPVKLKRRMQYKSSVFTENIRPTKVLKALKWLKDNGTLYKEVEFNFDTDWQRTLNEQQSGDMMHFLDADDVPEVAPMPSTSQNGAETTCSLPSENLPTTHDDTEDDNNVEEAKNKDNFNEVDDAERTTGNMDTMLDTPQMVEPENPEREHAEGFTFAPGEGQTPLALVRDADAEYLSFPTIFCGHRRSATKIPVYYSDICKYELRSVDRRVSQNIPNVFFKLKKLQTKQIGDKVSLAVRRCKSKGKSYTAEDVLNDEVRDNMVRLDEGYYIFRTIRNSPPYLENKKKEVFSMIRQLGIPTLFISLSAADTQWIPLLKCLGKLIDNTDYTEEQINEFNWQTRSRLLSADPVTCARYFDHRFQEFMKIVLKGPFNPLGVITDSFYRVEFQQRGSPHIHMALWIEGAPKYADASEEEVVKYIDSVISVSSDVSDTDKPYLALQYHKHSQTCRKFNAPVCRFGFPLPPMRITRVLELLDPNEDNEIYKQNFLKIQNKLKDMGDGKDVTQTFNEFIEELGMTEEEYIKSIQSSLKSPKVFLKRKPSEIRINPYMKGLLHCWQANHDIQYILDGYAVAVYIIAYTCKSQKGMSALLDTAAKEAKADNMALKQAVRHMGNKFLNCVETGAQEAAYLVLQTPITRASREVIFINTNKPEERPFILKDKSKLEKMDPLSTDVQTQGMITYYARRPSVLRKYCLADYASFFSIKYPQTPDDGPFQDNLDDDPTHNAPNPEPEPIVKLKGKDLEDHDFDVETTYVLKSGMRITKRKNPRVIRYVNFNKDNSSEDYYRERIMLFHPWANSEDNLMGNCDTYEQQYKHLQATTNVEVKRRQYERHNDALREAIAQAEEDGLDNLEQDEIQDTVQTPECLFFDPDRPENQRTYDMAQDIGISIRQSDQDVQYVGPRLPDDQYYDLVRTLNCEQREIFTHVIQSVKMKKDEKLYMFITGGAGTGKSQVVKALYQFLLRHLCSTEGQNPEDIRIQIVAPSGFAAYIVKGSTLHSAFAIGFKQNVAEYKPLTQEKRTTLRAKYRHLKFLIIDEISMVGCKMFAFVHLRLQEIMGENKLPFGGVNVITIGDMYQLQPVFDKYIFEDIPTAYGAFATNLWKEYFSMYELHKIMRQQGDLSFADALNRLRTGSQTNADIELLKTRIITTDYPNYPSDVPHLYLLRRKVSDHNNDVFNKVTTAKAIVHAQDTIVTNCSQNVCEKILNSVKTIDMYDCQAGLNRILNIAVSLMYSISLNLNLQDGLVNGSSCTVKSIQYQEQLTNPSIIWVEFEDKKIGQEQRNSHRSMYSSGIEKCWTPIFAAKRSYMWGKNHIVMRTQFPLKPSNARTIHSSQGGTFNKVVVDMSTGPRCPPIIAHAHYVALSRVCSITDLYIIDLAEKNICQSNAVKEYMPTMQHDKKLQLCYTPVYSFRQPNALKIVFNNSRSVHAHFNDLKQDPNITEASIVGLAESRLKPSDHSDQYELENFQLKRNDQQHTHNMLRPPHGLMLYAKTYLKILDTTCYSNNQFEAISAHIHHHHHRKVIHVLFIYASPKCSFTNLSLNLQKCLSDTNPDEQCIVMGDFNMNSISSAQDYNAKLENFMLQQFNLHQYMTKATTNYNTKLDLMFTSPTFNNIAIIDVIDNYWSDHKIVFAAFNVW